MFFNQSNRIADTTSWRTQAAEGASVSRRRRIRALVASLTALLMQAPPAAAQLFPAATVSTKSGFSSFAPSPFAPVVPRAESTPADLVVRSVALDLERSVVRIDVENLGGGRAGRLVAVVELVSTEDLDGPGVFLGASVISGLSPRAGVVHDVEIEWPPYATESSYAVRVEADALDDVSEGNDRGDAEVNNRWFGDVVDRHAIAELSQRQADESPLSGEVGAADDLTWDEWLFLLSVPPEYADGYSLKVLQRSVQTSQASGAALATTDLDRFWEKLARRGSVDAQLERRINRSVRLEIGIPLSYRRGDLLDDVLLDLIAVEETGYRPADPELWQWVGHFGDTRDALGLALGELTRPAQDDAFGTVPMNEDPIGDLGNIGTFDMASFGSEVSQARELPTGDAKTQQQSDLSSSGQVFAAIVEFFGGDVAGEDSPGNNNSGGVRGTSNPDAAIVTEAMREAGLTAAEREVQQVRDSLIDPGDSDTTSNVDDADRSTQLDSNPLDRQDNRIYPAEDEGADSPFGGERTDIREVSLVQTLTQPVGIDSLGVGSSTIDGGCPSLDSLFSNAGGERETCNGGDEAPR